MVNRILFYIRKKLKHCYSCGTKMLDIKWDKTNMFIIQRSNGGLAHILDHGWGYACYSCIIDGFKYRSSYNP